MSNRIKILDAVTANQIAAGEVVERPASVVKELVENALDAGADKIEIAINGAGVALIRVTDNGCGMSGDDAIMALQRHATSKISSTGDLAEIATLGFRGEAVPSIASVSRLEVTTREHNSVAGCRILVAGGAIEQVSDIGCPAGTVFTVKDLFFNTPARRKFLKSAATELGQISDIISRMAMAYPKVAFKYMHEGRILLQTSGTGSLLETVSQVYGKEQAKQMIRLDTSASGFTLEGYLGSPNQSRSTRAQQTFFVNGRYIKSKILTVAVAEGYKTVVPANRYPIVVLNLLLPLQAVDVNVHPTKLEVRFAQANEVSQFVAQAVRQTLNSANLMPGNTYPDVSNSFAVAARQYSGGSSSSGGVAEATHLTTYAQVAFTDQASFKPPICHRVVSNEVGHHAVDQITTDPVKVLSDDQVTIPTSKLPDIVVLGQVDATYIVGAGPEGLYIIDQHAAHERINFEQFWARAEQTRVESQLLLQPITLELSQQEMGILVENVALFIDLGFLLEHFGGNTFLLRGHPLEVATAKPGNLVHDLLALFVEGPKHIDLRQLREEMIYTIACKASVTANMNLNQIEMDNLLWRLGQTQNPYTCPHGRPTIIALNHAELAKRFQRT